MENKKILVTGGAGFIGSHLCESLVLKNEVFCLDNYLTGSKSNHIDGVVYFEGSAKDISKILANETFDIIYHLGEYSRVESSFEDYLDVVENNVIPFSYVLEYARKKNAKLVYSGSSTKFGDTLGGENASPYAWSKSQNTKHLINYCNWFGINYAIVYFYNAYGGREISDGKYATLIGKYKRLFKAGNKTLPVVKPGDQVRNFTHFSDIVSALIAVGEKGTGDGYGIGYDKSHKINDVVKYFGLVPEYLDKRKGNRLTADLKTEKTKSLGWEAKVCLSEHIKEFLKTI